MNARSPLVDVTGLSIEDRSGRRVVEDVGLRVPCGSSLGIVGPSGAGKTSVALSLLGEIRPGLRHAGGTVRVAGTQPLGLRERELRQFRRSRTAWLGQDPAAALTPTMPVAALVGEPLPRSAHRKPRVLNALQAVGLPADGAFLRRLPHQVSGGQRRCIALARALIREPDLVILDEPLAGLDIHSRAMVLSELAEVRRSSGVTLVVVSHDLQAMSELTDRLIIMESGRVVEAGDTSAVLTAPASPTGVGLIEALTPAPPRRHDSGGSAAPVLSAQGISAAHPGQPPVIEGLDFSIETGQGIALVGASGVGKTTLARTLVGLMPLAGGIITMPQGMGDRSGRIGFVPQDPALALNPARTIASTLRDAIRRTRGSSRHRIDDLLERVGLDPGLAARRPGTLSGGQRQRVAIARALACDPDLLVCDEPTSALDPIVAAGVMDLLDELRRDGLAILLISHEWHTIGRVATDLLELREATLVPVAPEAFSVGTPENGGDAYRRCYE